MIKVKKSIPKKQPEPIQEISIENRYPLHNATVRLNLDNKIQFLITDPLGDRHSIAFIIEWAEIDEFYKALGDMIEHNRNKIPYG